MGISLDLRQRIVDAHRRGLGSRDHYRGASTDVLVAVPPGVRLEVWDIEYPKDCQCFEVEYAGQRGWVMYNRGRFDRE